MLKEEYKLGFTYVVDFSFKLSQIVSNCVHFSFKLSQIAYIRFRGIFKQQDHYQVYSHGVPQIMLH